MPEPAGKQFPEFLGSEVLPFINAHYRVMSGPKSTSLGGASYGAVAALYTLLMRPDLFGAGIVESPALQVGNGQLLRDTAFVAAGPGKVFLSMGTDEVPGQPLLNSGMAEMFRVLVKNIESAYIGKTQMVSVLQQGGTHDEKSWSALFERGVVFLYKSQ
jgi:predicted alpha/beta superfamily hydrolase